MLPTGGMFGLGFSELVLILIAVIFIMGPEKLAKIKPFLKVAYKGYLSYMREVNSMQGEVDDVRKTIMEPIEEAKHEAEEEFRKTQAELSEGTKGFETMRKLAKQTGFMSKKQAEGKMPSGALPRGQAGRQGMAGRKQGRFQPRAGAASQRTAIAGGLGMAGRPINQEPKPEEKPPKVDTPITVEPKKEKAKEPEAKDKPVQAKGKAASKKEPKAKADAAVTVGPEKTGKKKKRGSKA